MKNGSIKIKNAIMRQFLCLLAPLVIIGCSSYPNLPEATTRPSLTTNVENYQYLIGPGDNLNIFVWRNPEISGSFVVRPDGKVTTSLVEDIPVTGRTPSALARQLEEQLSKFINNPRVTVSVGGFKGPLSEQVRVIGEATNPTAVNFTEHMTLLDLMVAVGGITEFADGNEAKLIRVVNNKKMTFNIYIDDLIRQGDITKNIDMLPGDIIIIPEALF